MTLLLTINLKPTQATIEEIQEIIGDGGSFFGSCTDPSSIRLYFEYVGSTQELDNLVELLRARGIDVVITPQ